MNRTDRTQAHGFTLTELAVVLVIVAFLLGGLLIPLSAQNELRRTDETNRTLEVAREALTGFAIVNGRLPCPAWDGSWISDTTTTHGSERFDITGNASNGQCDNFYRGLLPARSLGLTPVDSDGFLLDGWGQRIRYAVSNPGGKEFTKANGIRSYYQSNNAFPVADLRVCNTSISATATACGNASSTLADSVVAVIYSLGPNGPGGGTSADESQNPSIVQPGHAAYIAPDSVFVSHEQRPDFDDLLTWVSPNVLIARMVAAQQLP